MGVGRKKRVKYYSAFFIGDEEVCFKQVFRSLLVIGSNNWPTVEIHFRRFFITKCPKLKFKLPFLNSSVFIKRNSDKNIKCCTPKRVLCNSTN